VMKITMSMKKKKTRIPTLLTARGMLYRGFLVSPPRIPRKT
jgi:hypothetical protein